MNFLVDTNVVSELGRKSPNRNVAAWAGRIDAATLHLSVLTLGEIAKGATKLARLDAKRGTALERWLDGLRRDYGDRIIGVDGEIAETWGRLSSGRSLPVIDTLLVATALVRGMTLVTRNVRDIADSGVQLLNPWDA